MDGICNPGSGSPPADPEFLSMAMCIRTGLLFCLLLLGSCGSAGLKVFAGYTQVEMSGTVALDSSVGGVDLGTIQVDLEDDLGLTDEVGSPYGRAEVDLGLIHLTGSGFIYDEQSTGTLSFDFGDITFGSTVESDIEIMNFKGAITFDMVDVGPLRLSPGVGVDLFDIDMNIRSTAPIVVSERVEILTPVPMLFLQTELDFGPVGAMLDTGWMSLDLGDVKGTWIDIEGLATFNMFSAFEIFAGYRYISIDTDGDADGQAFEADVELQGWIVGGGISW